MDPNNQPKQPQRPVMDVQRPRPNPAPSEVTSPLDKPMAPADSIANATPDPGQVIGQQPTLQQTTPIAATPKKNRTGLIVALCTIAAIVLIGAGVGGFILYKNSQEPAPATAPVQSESERVNVEEIDATTAEIDKTLNTLNDSTDITSSEVSDGPLGL